jgi:hypothetical protein
MQLGMMTTQSHVGDLDYWLTVNGERFDAMLYANACGILPNGGRVVETVLVDLPIETPTFKVVVYPDGRPELLWGQDMSEVVENLKNYTKNVIE